MSTCNCILKSNSPCYFWVSFADPRNITNGFRSNCELMWPQTRCYFWNIALLLSLIHDISILLYLTVNLDSSCIHVNVFHCEILFYRISEFPGKNFLTVWIDLSDQFQISPAAFPEMLTTHSMKNLTFHSLRGWKMTYYQFWLTCTFLFWKELGECTVCTFWTWEWKAYCYVTTRSYSDNWMVSCKLAWLGGIVWPCTHRCKFWFCNLTRVC